MEESLRQYYQNPYGWGGMPIEQNYQMVPWLYQYPYPPSIPMYPMMPEQMPAPEQPLPMPKQPTTGIEVPGILPSEQSYIENILRLNIGKMATVYATYENNKEWNAKVFVGKVEAAGIDHIILSDPKTGMRYLLLMVNVDYITFNEPLNYIPPKLPQPR